MAATIAESGLPSLHHFEAATTETIEASTPTTFFSLPYELRCQVYEHFIPTRIHIFTADTATDVENLRLDYRSAKATIEPWSLVRTSRQVRYELRTLVYPRTTIEIHLANLSLATEKTKEPYQFWIDGLDEGIGLSLKGISMNAIVEHERLKFNEEDRVFNKAAAGESLSMAEANLLYGRNRPSTRYGQWKVDSAESMYGRWYLERAVIAMSRTGNERDSVDAVGAEQGRGGVRKLIVSYRRNRKICDSEKHEGYGNQEIESDL
ncbi:MAG: hypothetical protein LQ337_007641 [Flavoplaca oasis]|nr:MAG: hypothetical protein LQ337_007641 [Flavoplaca oasis]